MGGKSRINSEEFTIWERCWGPKGLGLSVMETWNAIDILRKHLQIYPRMLVLGDDVRPFYYKEFTDFERRCREPGMPDNFLSALYVAEDIEAVIKCSSGTVYGWASALGRRVDLPLRRGTEVKHPFSSVIRPPPAVVQELRDEEVLWGTSTIRTYNIEFLVFFLLAYSDGSVWEQPILSNRLFQVWDKLGKLLNVQACPILKAKRARNRTQAPVPPTTVPKHLPRAATSLVSYLPTPPPPASSEKIIDDEISRRQQEIERLSRELQEVENAKARLMATKASILHPRSVLESSGIYTSLAVSYPNGVEATYRLEGVSTAASAGK